MMWPVSSTGAPAAVARRIRRWTITVGEGMISWKQFSMLSPLSKSRISCVPVPTSTARIRTRSLTMPSLVCALANPALLLHREVGQHGGDLRVLAVQPQIVVAHPVRLIFQDALLDAGDEQFAGGIAGEAATEAVLRIVWVADEVGDAANRAPGPVTVNVIEELDEPGIIRLDWGEGGSVGLRRRYRARRHCRERRQLGRRDGDSRPALVLEDPSGPVAARRIVLMWALSRHSSAG